MTQVSEMRLSLDGLTEEQKACFRLGHCTSPAEHRWIGPNFPTPEGACPFCIDPEVVQAFQSVQVEMLTKEQAMPKRTPVDMPPVSPFPVPPPIADIISKSRRQRIERYRALRNTPRKEP